jgi:hypothetical protein
MRICPGTRRDSAALFPGCLFRRFIDEAVEKDYSVTEDARETLRLEYTGNIYDAINNSGSSDEIPSFAISYRTTILRGSHTRTFIQMCIESSGSFSAAGTPFTTHKR